MSLINKVTLTFVGSLVLGVVGWHTTKYFLQTKKTNISSTQTTIRNNDVDMISVDESENEKKQETSRNFKDLFNNL